MTDTVKDTATKAGASTPNLFGEFGDRAKTALAKGQKITEQMVEFQKGNVEALVASTKIAAKSLETIGQETAEIGRKNLETAQSAFKSFSSAKSPTELFKLQSDYAKSSFEDAVAQTSKNTEAALKLFGEIFQPLSNRFALAAEKMKSSV